MTKSTKAKLSRTLLPLFFFALFCCLNGCGSSGGGSDTPTSTGPTTPTAASLDLSASNTTVKSDDSTTTTITVTALNASNAAVSGVTVTMGADSGIIVLEKEPFVTDITGKVRCTFSSGGNPINRTATITAVSGTVSKQIPVQIVGSTLTMTSTGTQLPDDGTSPVTLTLTAKDGGSNTVQNATVVITKTGTGNVSITPASGVTLADGTFTTIVTAAAGGAGTATLTATALGMTATTAFTVTPTLATFSIDQQTLNGTVIANNNTTAMKIGQSLEIRIRAPSPTTNVIFATTTGAWNGTTKVVLIPVVAQKATATLTTTQAGIASVQVYDPDNPATSDTLTVAMTSGEKASSIYLQATPTVVPKSVGLTTGSSTLTAMVRDASGIPIGDAPVAFSILNSTGGGETITPVVVLTSATPSGGLALGEARASFISGSLSSGTTGLQIRASVVVATDPPVETEQSWPVRINNTPSGNDASIVIGGTAGSIAFGRATVLGVNDNATAYVMAMSVLVADSNGNPAPTGTRVSLSAWPIAWSTGVVLPCAHDADNGVNQGTFLNEDVNENLVLDSGEDGKRAYSSGVNATGVGTIDTLLTPVNSDGGTLPATLLTDANGLAGFNLTYPKDSAIWTVVRIRASTIVQGSETVAQTIFRLPALESDVSTSDPTKCRLICPYDF